MSFEFLLVRVFDHSLDNLDRDRNRLLGVCRIRITDKKLHKVADLKP